MLDEDLVGEHLIRTKFFLGVIRYRQAIPLRAQREPFDVTPAGWRRLADARRLMTELVDDRQRNITKSTNMISVGTTAPFRKPRGETPFRHQALPMMRYGTVSSGPAAMSKPTPSPSLRAMR